MSKSSNRFDRLPLRAVFVYLRVISWFQFE